MRKESLFSLWAVAVCITLSTLGCQRVFNFGTAVGAVTGDTTTGSAGSAGSAGTGAGGMGSVTGNVGVGGRVTAVEPVIVELEELPDGGTAAPTPVERVACTDIEYWDKFTPRYNQPRNPEVDALLQRMTPEQKFKQMQGYVGPDEKDLQWDNLQQSHDDEDNQIRGYRYRDGPRGLNVSADYDGVDPVPGYATAFPVSMSRGASWDQQLEYDIGVAQGDETVAVRGGVLLTPCMNILRHPAWGRSQETYGEDNMHVGRIATASVAGLQKFIGGCAKHYTANNIEAQRDRINAAMDEQTLREIYGTHFEQVVRDGGVSCVMASYNRVNGTKSTQNYHTLTEILRDDMGFRGYVISDWWAMPPPLGDWATPLDAQRNTVGAVKAGLDIEVPWINNFFYLPTVYDRGELTEVDIDKAAGRVLEQKYRFNTVSMDPTAPWGLQPQPQTTTWTDSEIVGNEPHIALARKAAAEGMVLLKNDDATLPLTDATPNVAVIGAQLSWSVITHVPADGVLHMALDVALGDRGSSRVNADPMKTTGALAGLEQVADEKGLNITFTPGTSAAEVGADADLAVVFVGHTPSNESEEYQVEHGGDRLDYNLSKDQNALIESVAALGIPVVVVMETGGSVALPWRENPNIKAIVQAFFPGQAGGLGMADQLLGANTWGRLPFTWAESRGTDGFGDWPAFNTGPTMMGTTEMDYFVGYKRFEKEGITPLYPFGYGLSYTTFRYANLQVPCSTATDHSVINVTVDITNEGTVAGDAVPQLYVSFPSGPDSTPRRNLKELKAFRRVSIDPGVTKRVTLPVRVEELKYWDIPGNKWAWETGTHTIRVGASSADAETLTDTFELQ